MRVEYYRCNRRSDMALTTEDLNNIGRLLSGFATKDDLKGFATKDDLKEGLAGLRGEMHDGFEKILDTMNEHMIDTDRRFMSDRKRLERLEKIVL